MNPIVSIDNLTLGYRTHPWAAPTIIMRDLSFELIPGQTMLIVGPNGSGKSTLCKALCHLIQPVSGTINTPYCIGYVAQTAPLPPLMTVHQVLKFVLKTREATALKSPSPLRPTITNIIHEYLREFNLVQYSNTPTAELSKGTSTRLKFAMTKALNPTVLILDEPFCGLDEESKEIVLAYLQQAKLTGTGIITTGHAFSAFDAECNGLIYNQKIEWKILNR